ncbi:MAG: hypothetical protein QOI35_229 [Cryptosporangiaceae bacterium]|nr:hypothetical protein [Cryptosporangiaceae bacterium]
MPDHPPGSLSRRSVLAGMATALGVAGTAGRASAAPPPGAPALAFANPAMQSALGGPYEAALTNLLVTNTVPYDPAVYNRTRLMSGTPGTFFRAGQDYAQPWTRDAAINSWNAGSLLSPAVARNTLWSVCDRRADGSLVILQDGQWWDQVIWGRGAWSYYTVTGDTAFLADAYQALANTLAIAEATRFNATYGLFAGPAVMQDGIAGYPAPPADPKGGSSSAPSYPAVAKIMCLSTNCVYAAVYATAADMAGALGRPAAERTAYLAKATALRNAINTRLWIPAKGLYGYFLHGSGSLAGTLDQHEETLGLAFAILLGVADGTRTASIMAGHHRAPYGVVNVWPHFPPYTDAMPGRHEAVVWPMVQGFWAHAAARAGRTGLFATELSGLAALARNDGNTFSEIYNATTGVRDGGYQVAGGSAQVHWDSTVNQTWSASAYLRMLYAGLFGMSFAPSLLTFAPSLPDGWGQVTLSGLKYRAAALTVVLTGAGRTVKQVTLDGAPAASATVPGSSTGSHTLRIELTTP